LEGPPRIQEESNSQAQARAQVDQHKAWPSSPQEQSYYGEAEEIIEAVSRHEAALGSSSEGRQGRRHRPDPSAPRTQGERSEAPSSAPRTQGERSEAPSSAPQELAHAAQYAHALGA
jgi:hypothetical protein